MYSSEVFKESFYSFTLPTERIWQLVARVRSALPFVNGWNRGQALHDVLGLDIVSGLGETPSAYGWHVDSVLNVRLHAARNPVRSAQEPPPDEEDRTPPERGMSARVYRVPRPQRRIRLQLMQGGLAGDAA